MARTKKSRAQRQKVDMCGLIYEGNTGKRFRKVKRRKSPRGNRDCRHCSWCEQNHLRRLKQIPEMRFAASMEDVEHGRHFGTDEDEFVAGDVLELSQPNNEHRKVYTTTSSGYQVFTPDFQPALLNREERRGAFSTSATSQQHR